MTYFNKNIIISLLKSCIKNTFKFNGRIGVIEYIFSISIIFFVLPTMTLFNNDVDIEELNGRNANGLAIHAFLILIIIILDLVYTYLCTVKRLHDISLSGWWSILTIFFIPLIANSLIGHDSLFLLFVLIKLSHAPLFFIKGVKGKNKYGDPPEF